jgi:hypothetical protein
VAVSSSNGLVSGVLLRRYRLRPSAALSSSTVRVWPHFTRGRPQHLTFLRDRMKGRRAVKVSLHQQVGGGALEISRSELTKFPLLAMVAELATIMKDRCLEVTGI